MLFNDSMLRRSTFFAGFVAIAGLFGAGCSNSGASGTGGGGGSTGSAGGSAPSVCANDPRAEAYKVGLTGKSTDGAMNVRFMNANPSPPSRGNNTLTITITDKAGKPVDGASIKTLTYMPDHGHGSSIDPTATASGKPGEYVIDPVNLFMPGIWQITFDVSEKSGATDSVEFTFCVDG